MPANQTHSMHKTDLRLGSPALAQSSVLHLTADDRIDLSSHNALGLEPDLLSGVFAADTLIDTPLGSVPIEELGAGDEVCSVMNGKVAVQNCIAVPDFNVPQRVLCIRSGYLHAKADLITLPYQLVRLDHWLSGALFGTKFPFAAANRILIENKIETVSKKNVQFYRLDLGVSDAITANGVVCITDKLKIRNQNDEDSCLKNYAHRELTLAEVQQALEAGSFFRKSETKK